MASSKQSRKQQARIAFTPLPSSSPAAKEYHSQIQDRAAAVRYETRFSSPLRQQTKQPAAFVANNANTFLPTPVTPSGAQSSSSQARRNTSRSHKSGQQKLYLTARDTQHDDNGGQQSNVNWTKAAEPVQSQVAKQCESSDDSDDAPVRSTKKRRIYSGGFMSSATPGRASHQRRLNLRSQDDSHDISVAAPVSSDPPVRILSTDDDDDMPTTLGQRRRGTQPSRSSPVPSPSPSAAGSSEDAVEIIHIRPATADEPEDSEENSDPVPRTPQRRKLKRGRQLTKQERDDLDDDIEALQPSSVDEPLDRPRDSQSIRKAARRSALDALKRKRAGQPEAAPSKSVNESADDGLEAEDSVPYVIDDDEDDHLPTSSAAMFQADADDEHFVDDDEENDTLGVPGDIPLEFTRYAAMKPKELFKYAIDWMVQKKLNPAFEIRDDLYTLTFKKLNDEVLGLARSKFTSSAWTYDFSTALNSRPSMEKHEMSAINSADFLSDHCDACNRSKHPATFQIQFKGKPYHFDTLDEVEARDEDESSIEDDESDVSISNDKPSYDASGRKVPPANIIYNVGRQCAKNAETAHVLQHWKRNLYDDVVGWIEHYGCTSAEELVRRDGWSNKRKRKFADKISNRMHEKGVTKKLWKEFRDSITWAQDFKQGRF